VSAPELVTVTVDGREIQVPKGTGMVEAAALAGVEIPVFCYEPRLGAPVGACRMCLCEVEGMPKLQAACTMTAQDGLVFRTAQTSAKAAEGQNAVLEFILLNHPLDCPDCDKGGECPLQDLTFRWGPGATRMRFPKKTLDKPIPISPLIALDRERCILCYRCTRFSEGIAEDGQLVARNRGAQSIIATFEDEPYRAHFSGNVTELCPVGALLPTTYRHRTRPWEIDHVPTVCGLCSVGCNLWASTREGKVLRVLSRNHPDVDDGWICDKGRFAFGHLRAEDRLRDPLVRVRRRGFDKASWDDALDRVEEGLRAAEGNVVVAFSGAETVEIASALGRLVRQGLGSDVALLPDEAHAALDAYRAPLSAIAAADLCVVVGDQPVVERAPVVDLWLKGARRNGARLVLATPTGNVAVAPGSAAAVCAELSGESPREELREAHRAIREARRVALVWSDDDPSGGLHVAGLAARLGSETSVYLLPRSPNGRGVAQAWLDAGRGRGGDVSEGEIGALIVSGDEATYDPRVAELAQRARFVLTSAMFMGEATLWSHVLLPGTGYLERDGTMLNLEGRPQRVRRAVDPPGLDELAWLSRLGERFGVGIDPWPSEALPAERAELPARSEAPAAVAAPRAMAPQMPGEGLRLVRYHSLFSGPAVARVPQLQFQRPPAEAELAWTDAQARGLSRGDAVLVRSNSTSVELRATVSRKLPAGLVRIADEHAAGLEDLISVEARPQGAA
jgi:NADH-quinone oxidoreductase subunit G